ncbi:MAG TPA: endopeptidase La [Gemmataceae bacterium]|nr:endopeptidase La [Gemmataceae bacterium]
MSENTQGLVHLPVLPLKNTVLFPYLLLPLTAGRPASVAAVDAALATEDKSILIVAQRDGNNEQPASQDDLFTIGTRAVIKKMARADEGVQIIVQGVERVVLVRVEQTTPYLKAVARPHPLPDDTGTEVEALHRAVLELAARALSLAQPQTPIDLSQLLAQAREPIQIVYLIASMLSLDLQKEQQLLEAATVVDALRLLHQHLSHEVQVLELRQKITSEAQTEMSKQQREYMLRQQLRAIQQELGEQDPEKAEVALLRERFDKAELPEHVRKEAERELGRLEKLPPAAPDYQLTRSYLELVLELPWRKGSETVIDIPLARQVLDEGHYNLKDVKERILEHLAVLKLNPEANAPILCFVGPPGVGKTSLGQSIARALGRKFELTSLGGLHDEAELRGHRRTYIGAMPGRIIQAIRRAGVNNPVLMLDEVVKLGRDYRGDPSAALMEILDPAQNKEFRDNYLDLPFDLSKVFFIATANTLDTIPQPLLDRMELLRLAGYSEDEKLQIARRFLLPRQLTQSGLKPEQLTIPDETVKRLTQCYTREAGLRQLERALGRLCRKVAIRFAEGHTEPVTVKPEDLAELLGPEPFSVEHLRQQMPPGVVTGLAWTEAGGDVLYVEATLLPGGRGLTLTGQLGKVMQESATAAQSYVWSHADELGIDRNLFRRAGVHIHVPAGAVPKDGPSAGVAMATALTSLYTHRPIRRDTAMTGEISLTGLVLPVGGIKEKVLAAHRAGVRQVILPKDNEKDLRDIPESVRRDLHFVFAERMDEVIAAAIPALAENLAEAVAI